MSEAGIARREMKDRQFSHAGFLRHHSRLPGREMIPASGLVRVLFQIRGLTVKDVGALRKPDDLVFVLFVVPRIDDVSDFLTAADGDESLADFAQ